MTTFSSNSGWVTTDIAGSAEGAEDMAVQTDGKILLAGYGTTSGKTAFALVRHNADGSLDTAFGSEGAQLTSFGSGQSIAYAMVLQADGKILLAGDATASDKHVFALASYNTDGSLDTGFSDDGKLTTGFGTWEGLAYAAALQADGKILVAGDIWNGSQHDFGLMRLNADGSLDTGFGGDGQVSTDFGGYDAATSIVVQSDGKILVAGSSYDGKSWDFAVARYNADGSLDTGFSDDGMLTTDIATAQGFGGSQKSSHDYAADMKVSATGKIYVAGSASAGSGYDFALARYAADGTLEGVVTTDFGSNDYGSSLVLQTDGKMVIAGKSGSGSKSDMALARYNALDGSLDTTLDGDGKMTIDIGGKSDDANALVLQADDKLLVAGQADTGTAHFVLARLNGDGSLAATNEKAGTAKADKLTGNGAADWMLGMAGNDSLTGASGNDTLDGGDGKDTLVAGEGDDSLMGGAGVDKLTGGGGADTFFFANLEKSAVDSITDFTESDSLVFDTSAFDKLANATADNLAYGTKATAPGHYLIFNATTGKLYYDADGSGTDSKAIQIAGIKGSGAKNLSIDDMIFGDVFALL